MTLKVEGVIRHYPGNPEPTLKGLSFELAAGTLAALLGRSGAGKSTLLRCITGLEPFERGTIVVGDVGVRGTEEVSRQERARSLTAARARLSLVFQGFELFPHLTARDNCILAPVHVKKVARAQAERRASELLCQLGLEERLDAFPDQLSGGQKQRVAIARALAMDPQVLLFDEPTSALDASMKQEVLETLRRVDTSGVTQVVVTHDLHLAQGVEHVCVLEHGTVVESGAAQQVFGAPRHPSTRALLMATARTPDDLE